MFVEHGNIFSMCGILQHPHCCFCLALYHLPKPLMMSYTVENTHSNIYIHIYIYTTYSVLFARIYKTHNVLKLWI